MLNVDSGADRHLLKPKDITKRRNASKGEVEWGGKGYQSAASCEGYAEFNLGKGKNSVDIEAHAWGVADVTTRLLSVQRLVADGVDVHFSKSGSYLDFTKVGGGRIPIDANSMVRARMRAVSLPEAPAPVASAALALSQRRRRRSRGVEHGNGATLDTRQGN